MATSTCQQNNQHRADDEHSASQGSDASTSNITRRSSAADQAGCARARPYVFDAMLRYTHCFINDDEAMVNAEQAAPATSNMGDIDITTPETAAVAVLHAIPEESASQSQSSHPENDDMATPYASTQPAEACMPDADLLNTNLTHHHHPENDEFASPDTATQPAEACLPDADLPNMHRTYNHQVCSCQGS